MQRIKICRATLENQVADDEKDEAKTPIRRIETAIIFRDWETPMFPTVGIFFLFDTLSANRRNKRRKKKLIEQKMKGGIEQKRY